MSKMKKIIRIAIIAVLVVLAGLTFVSRTVYHRGLPRVSSAGVNAGYVPLVFIENTFVTAGGAWRVAEVAVEEGARVEPGDVLLSFDLTEFELALRELELEIRRLEAVQYPDGLDAYALELAKERLDFLVAQSPPAELIAATAGQITALSAAPGRIAAPGAPLLIIRNEIVERGWPELYVVPRDAVFYVPLEGYFVFAINNRRGILGPEDYVQRFEVSILRDNGRVAAIYAASEAVELGELTLARDIEGFVQNGDTVWVRER